MAKDNVEISVIIPVRNQLEKLERLLQGIEDGKPQNISYETLVMDDASSQDLRPACAKYNATHHRLDEGRGPANARNEGANLAAGKILLFLDADVAYPPGLMEKIIAELESDAELASVSFLNQRYDPSDGTIKNFGSVMEHYWGLKLFGDGERVAYGNGFTSRNGAVRKEVYEQLGGFDTSYQTNAVEDYDFGKRISARFKTAFVTEPIVYHSFPDSFSRLMRNYFLRSALFVQYQLKKRPGLDRTQTTGSEMLLRLTGFASLLLILGSQLPLAQADTMAGLGSVLVIVYAFMMRNLLASAMRWSGGTLFTANLFAIHYASNPVIILGTLLGMVSALSTSRITKAAGSMGKATLRGDVKYLIFHVTSRCNAGCRMCFNWDGMKEREGEPDISLEKIASISKSIGHLPQLTLSGGEPLLRSDVPDILKSFYTNAGTRFFTVPTNALMPERVESLIENFSKKCPEGFLNICLPFHGKEKLFNEIMGVPAAYSKFRETYSVIKRERGKRDNISCTLNFVMSRFNHEHYREVIELAGKEFPDSVIGIALARGETHERQAVDFPIESYEEAYAYLLKKNRGNGSLNPFTIINSSIAKQMGATVKGVIDGEVESLNCKAGKNILVIYENGSVYPCELLEVTGIPKGDGAPTSASLGKLDDFNHDIGSLLKSDQAKKLTKWIATHNCSCTWECAIYSAIIHSPVGLARLGANAVRYFIR